MFGLFLFRLKHVKSLKKCEMLNLKTQMDDWLEESIKHDAILFANIRLAFSQNNNDEKF